MKDFDIDTFQEEFEESFEEEITTSDEEEVESTIEVEDESNSEYENDVEEIEDEEISDEVDEEVTEEQSQEVDESTDNSFDNERQELLSQVNEQSKYAKVLEEIAVKNGISTSELVDRYEKSKIQAEAEEKGIPFEFYERQLNTERELEQLKVERQRDVFNQAVSSTIQKYNLSESEVQNTINYAVEKGVNIVDGSVDFEAIYRLSNMDKIIQNEIKADRQKRLEEKQKRMNSSTIAHGGSAGTDTSVDDEVSAFLKEAGLYD